MAFHEMAAGGGGGEGSALGGEKEFVNVVLGVVEAAAIPIQYPPNSARATRNSVVCTEPTVGRPAAGGGDMPPSRPWANYIRRPS